MKFSPSILGVGFPPIFGSTPIWVKIIPKNEGKERVPRWGPYDRYKWR